LYARPHPCPVAAEAKDDQVKKDVENFQGNWVLASGENDGENGGPVLDFKATLRPRLEIEGCLFPLAGRDIPWNGDGPMTLQQGRRVRRLVCRLRHGIRRIGPPPAPGTGVRARQGPAR
jgi:hypothetical protein